MIWGLLSIRYPHVLIPAYSIVHYTLAPIAVFGAPDRRLTDISYTRSVLPLVLVCVASNLLVPCFGPTHLNVYVSGHVWKLFPLWTWVAQEILYRYILPSSTVEGDRLNNPRRDVPTIRRTMLTLCFFCVVSWQYALWTSGQTIAVDGTLGISAITGFTTRASVMAGLIGGQLLSLAFNSAWLGLLMWDLKASGMIKARWLTLAGCILALVVVGGQGAMVSGMWLYREESLATKKHRMAVVPEEKREKAPLV